MGGPIRFSWTAVCGQVRVCEVAIKARTLNKTHVTVGIKLCCIHIYMYMYIIGNIIPYVSVHALSCSGEIQMIAKMNAMMCCTAYKIAAGWYVRVSYYWHGMGWWWWGGGVSR